MRVARVLLVLAALPLLLTPALGQNAPHELYGELFSIENGEQSPKFFPNVQVTIREFDVSGLTNDQGAFRIRLPAAVLPGQEVTLRHDKEGYAIFSPLLGRLTIPAHSNEVVEVRLLPLDSPLFWSHDRIEEFIKRNANDTAKQTKGKESLWAAVLRRVQSIWRWYTELNTFLQATLGATAMYALLALTMGGFWLIRPSLLAHWAMPSLTASESPQWKGIVEAVALVRWLGTTQRALDAWLRQYDGALDARCFEGRKSVAGRPLSQYVDLERAEQIGAWKQALARGEPLACWVVGPGGCGKTTLALMLARHARATTKLYPVRPVLVEEDWGKDLTEHVARLLCVGDRRPSMAMVHKLGHTGRLIPVIDGLSERRVERAADQVKDLVVGGVFRRLVVTSRSGPPDGDWFQSLSVGPVPPDRVDDFLRAYGIGDDSRPGAVAEIAELSGSQPVRALFLKLSADQLLKGQDLPTSYPGLVRAFVVGSRPSGTDALREGDFLLRRRDRRLPLHRRRGDDRPAPPCPERPPCRPDRPGRSRAVPDRRWQGVGLRRRARPAHRLWPAPAERRGRPCPHRLRRGPDRGVPGGDVPARGRGPPGPGQPPPPQSLERLGAGRSGRASR